MGRRDGSKQMGILETPNSGVAILTNWKGQQNAALHKKYFTWLCKIITQKQKVYGEKALTISTHTRGKVLINTSQN